MVEEGLRIFRGHMGIYKVTQNEQLLRRKKHVNVIGYSGSHRNIYDKSDNCLEKVKQGNS